MRTKTRIIIQGRFPTSNMPPEIYANDTSVVASLKGKTIDLCELSPIRNLSIEFVKARTIPDEECGVCGHYHFKTFDGDCREDDERFVRAEG